MQKIWLEKNPKFCVSPGRRYQNQQILPYIDAFFQDIEVYPHIFQPNDISSLGILDNIFNNILNDRFDQKVDYHKNLSTIISECQH